MFVERDAGVSGPCLRDRPHPRLAAATAAAARGAACDTPLLLAIGAATIEAPSSLSQSVDCKN